MFERTLQDVVKGLRAQPTSDGRAEFAALVLQECKKELASTDGAIKSNAVLKVAHLRMLGYDDQNFGDDGTSFHVIETMALQPFKYKRIGYLAASSVLTSDSAVLLLATNSLKKELQSSEMYAVGLALGSTSSFTSRELARDLLPDVIAVATTSIKPYIRKRGTICLFRLCTRYPEGLREGAYDALRSKLDDTDQAVVTCAVNAVCELAKANPRNVLPLTPQLYQLLTSSGNNWLTIKVAKLYSSLMTVEPRLAKKLLDPLAYIIKSTSAKSLLYECIATVTKALRFVSIQDDDTRKKIEQVVALSALKLKEFVRDPDQNLKYLGLVGFVELTKSYPTVAQEHKDLVLLCLNDEDITVRLRALELLAGMATKATVAGIVSRLLEHLAKAPAGKFRDAVVQTCIDACYDDDYQRIPSCEWLIAVLMDLARLGKGAHGPLLAKNIMNVPMRVQSVRKFAANACARLVLEADSSIAPEVLASCAFVASEYYDETNEDAKDVALKVIHKLLLPDEKLVSSGTKPTTHQIPPEIRCVFVLNAFKLAAKVEQIETALDLSEHWMKSPSYKVRERTAFVRHWTKEGKTEFLLEEQLGPIHTKAQKKIPVPNGLDLSLRKCARSTATTASKVSVSFRGIQVPTYTPFTASDNPVVPYSQRPTSYPSSSSFTLPKAHDTSAFILGKRSASEKKRTNKSRKDDSSSSSSDVEPTDRNQRQAVAAQLWSSTLGSSVRDDDTNGSSIIITPAAMPAGASTLTDDVINPKPSASPGQITLADVDVLDENGGIVSEPREDLRFKPYGYGTGGLAEQVEKEKPKTKKKKKSKSSSSKSKESESVAQEPPSTGVQEQDLLDFSEL